MRIGIVVGSTRPGRRGAAVGAWVQAAAQQRDDAEFVLLDLAEFDLPLLDEPVVPSDANRDYARAGTRAWSRAVDACDGFVWITPEYNHGVPAAMKNAVDLLYPEWRHKTAGFVGYGFDGATRAVEHWRSVLAAAFMYTVRSQVALKNFTDWTDGEFTPLERRAGSLSRLLDQVVELTGTLAPLLESGRG